MIKTFTRNDILRFLYGEMNRTEAEEFKNSLSIPEIRDQYLEILQIINQLDAVQIEPPEAVIEKIKEYSRNTRKIEKV